MNYHETARVLYEQQQLPVFQNRMYDTAQQALDCPKGDVVLVENQQTGLVYNAAFKPELMVYDQHYQNEQGYSPLFQAHLESAAEVIGRCIGRDAVVEVGCGKGYFLEMLLKKGFDVTGFDPTYEGSNPRIRKNYFEPGSGIQAKGLVLRHVLEHIQDPYAFLVQLKEANGGSGKIYIEVPCLEWICEHRAWFDVFYEHVNYFRISDFLSMFGKVIENGKVFGQQYLYVVGELATLRPPRYDASKRVAFPKGFTDTLSEKIKVGQQACAVWGGASKGVIFALLKSRIGQSIATVIDINPAKQGKYLAATGICVQSPEEALPCLPADSTIYVMNSNYLAEIKEMSNNIYRYIGIDHE